MLKTLTAELSLEFGPVFSITYDYLIVNDGGDFKLFVWEQSPDDNSLPDLVLEKEVVSELQAENDVKYELAKAINQLIRSFIQFR